MCGKPHWASRANVIELIANVPTRGTFIDTPGLFRSQAVRDAEVTT